MSHAKSLNTTASSNKLRYQSSSKLASKTSASTKSELTSALSLHGAGTTPSSVQHDSNLAPTSSSASVLSAGTFTNDQLSRSFETNVTQTFKTLHRSLYPLTRSLPEIILNEEKIVDELVTYVGPENSRSQSTDLDACKIIGVLARDLGLQLTSSSFEKIMTQLSSAATGAGVSIGGDDSLGARSQEALQAMSHLISYCLPTPSTDSASTSTTHDSLRKYYAPLLSCNKSHVRYMSAEVFGNFLKRGDPSGFKKHYHKLMKSLAQSTPSASTKIFANTLDGISSLLFNAIRGTPGKLHSKAAHYLPVILKHAAKSTYTETLQVILFKFLLLTCRHLHKFDDVASQSMLCESISNVVNTDLTVLLFRRLIGFRKGSLLPPSYSDKLPKILLATLQHNTVTASSKVDLVATTFKSRLFDTSNSSTSDSLTPIISQISDLIKSDKNAAIDAAEHLLPTMKVAGHKQLIVQALITHASTDLAIVARILYHSEYLPSLPKKASGELFSLITKSLDSNPLACKILSEIVFNSTAEFSHSFEEKMLSSAAKALSAMKCPTPQSLECEIALKTSLNQDTTSLRASVSDLLLAQPHDAEVLKCAAKLSPSRSLSTTNALISNLHAPDSSVRCNSLSLLLSDDKENNTLTTLMQIQQLSPTLENEREYTLRLSKLGVLASDGNLSDFEASCLVEFLVGLLHVKLATVWSDAVKCFAQVGEKYTKIVAGGFADVLKEVMERDDVGNDEDEDEDDGDGDGDDEEEEEDNTANNNTINAANLAFSFSPESAARTDDETFKTNLLLMLEKTPAILLSKSKLLVPLFLRFLKNKFFKIHCDDPDRSLVADISAMDCKTNIRSVSNSLRGWLKAFGVITSPKQLFKQEKIFEILTALLSSSDPAVSSGALTAIENWKFVEINDSMSILNALVSETNFREALTKFEWSSVPSLHQEKLVKIITRVLFGKLKANNKKGSKKSRDTVGGRRNAVVAFFTNFTTKQVEPLLFLMLRQFDDSNESENLQDVESSIKRSPPSLSTIATSRLMGFLHLLENLIDKLGNKVSHSLPTFLNLTLAILDHATSEECKKSDSKSLRAQSYKCLVAFLGLKKLSGDKNAKASLWKSLESGVNDLPVVIENQESKNDASGLLLLLVCMSRNDINLLTDVQVVSVLNCLSPAANEKSLDAVLSFVRNLLEDEEDGVSLMKNQVDLLVTQCVALVESGASEGKLHSRVLNILFLLAENGALLKTYESAIIKQLAMLLIPFIAADKKEDIVDRILTVLSTFLPSLDEEDAISLWAPLSKCLGPVKNAAGIENLSTRQRLAATVFDLGKKIGPAFELVGNAVVDFNSTSKRRVGERDFDRLLPVLNNLGENDGAGWVHYAQSPKDSNNSISSILPLIFCAMNALYDDDGVINRGSFAAIKALLNIDDEHMIATTVMPIVKNGISSRNTAARKLFVLIVREAAIVFKDNANHLLFGDLNELVNSSDQDIDFFLNIVHLQVHRRGRALNRLRKLLFDKQISVGNSSLNNVLLPLAMHSLHETKSKSGDVNVALDGVACIGAIGSALQWGKYAALIHNLLQQIPRQKNDPDKERYLIGALCATLDSFHFNLEEENISNTLAKITINLQKLEVAEKTDKTNNTIKVLRSPIILAQLNLIMKLAGGEERDSKIYSLIQTVASTMKSKDSTAREIARKTLASMAVALGWSYVRLIIHIVAVTLAEGYMLDVRSHAVHAVLLALDGADANADSNSGLPFDAVPAVLDVIQNDVFGERSERKDAAENSDANVRVIKEAMGSKGLDSLELTLKNLELAQSDEDNEDCFHRVVGSFLGKVTAGADGGSKNVKRARVGLERIAAGIVRNSRVEGGMILRVTFATLRAAMSKKDRRGMKKKGKNKNKKKKPNKRKAGSGEKGGVDSGSDSESDMDLDDDDFDELEMAMNISSGRKGKMKSSSKKINSIQRKIDAKSKAGEGSVMFNSSSANVHSIATAIESKKRQRNEDARVQDGASAPKLTGWGRFGMTNYDYGGNSGSGSGSGSEGSGLSSQNNGEIEKVALSFALNLLFSSLKKNVVSAQQSQMLPPFLYVLTKLTSTTQPDDVIASAIHSLQIILKMNVSDTTSASKQLARNCLKLTTTTIDKSVQSATFKVLSQLGSEGSLKLSPPAASSLLNFLRERLLSGPENSHVTILGLVRVLCSMKVICSEMYELLDDVVEIVVRGNHVNVRNAASNIAMTFLLTYPMGDKKVMGIFNKVVKNCGYVYDEGRESGIGCLGLLVNKLPEEKLGEVATTVFLQSVLLRSNEKSARCRLALENVLETLFRRTANLSTVWEFLEKWIESGRENNNTALIASALAVVGILAGGREEFLRKKKRLGGMIVDVVDGQRVLRDNGTENGAKHGVWNDDCSVAVAGIDVLGVFFRKDMFNGGEGEEGRAWDVIVSMLVHPSVEVKLKAVALVGGNLRNVRSLYEVARNLTRSIDYEAASLTDELERRVVEGVVGVMVEMERREMEKRGKTTKRGKVVEPEDECEEKSLHWMMKRLVGIATNASDGGLRRRLAFRCFLGILSSEGKKDWIGSYAETIIEPLQRALKEDENVQRNRAMSSKRKGGWKKGDGVDGLIGGSGEEGGGEGGLIELVYDILTKLEEVLGTATFLAATTAVKSRMVDRNAERKKEAAEIKLIDAKLHAEMRRGKNEAEKRRKKRRTEEKRAGDGNKRLRR